MKIKIIIAFVLSVACLVAFSYTHLTSKSFNKIYLVKLYSDDKVVGTWNARNIGSIEGTTLTIIVGSEMDVNTRQVRISGTYSVEEIQ